MGTGTHLVDVQRLALDALRTALTSAKALAAPAAVLGKQRPELHSVYSKCVHELFEEQAARTPDQVSSKPPFVGVTFTRGLLCSR